MATTIIQKSNDKTITLSLFESEVEKVEIQNIPSISKDQFVTALSYVIKKLSRLSVRYSEQSEPECISAMQAALSHASDLESLDKSQLVKVYSTFSSCLDNYIELARVDSSYAEALCYVLLNPLVTLGDVCRLTNGEVQIACDPSWSFNTVLSDAAFRLYRRPIVKADTYEYRSFEHITVPVSESHRRAILSQLKGPDAVLLRQVETLPAGDELIVLNYESDIQDKLARMDALRAKGRFSPYTSVYRARINSLVGRLGIDEFPAEAGGGNPMCVQRGQLLGFAYWQFNYHCYITGKRIDFTYVTQFAQFVTDRLAAEMVSAGFSFLLPAYTGFSKTWEKYAHTDSVVTRILALVSQSDSGKWLATEHLDSSYLSVGIPKEMYYFQNSVVLFTNTDRFKSKLRPAGEQASSNVDGHSDVNWWKDITMPFVVHWLKLMCATGLLELAVSREAADDDPLEGIRYMRPTALGRYALGLTALYVPTADESAGWSYELDSDGIVISFGETPPYDVLLTTIGKRVSTNRFMVTAESLVIGSADRDELKRNVNTLRSLFNPEPGSPWDVMLNEALKRSNCIDNVVGHHLIIKLRNDVPGLIEAVLNSNEICSNCVKAEQGLLVVPIDYYPSLVHILHSKGFLLK